MNRVEKLKQIKTHRRRAVLLTVFLFSLILTGIAITDYSFNSLMKNQRRIEVISFRNTDNSCLEISVMNEKITINTKYIEKDLNNIKDRILRLLNF
jgi:cell division septal protein FtsQ